MPSEVETVAEEFGKELTAIRRLLESIGSSEDDKRPIDGTLRVAASNGSMLLLAASFEEFIRELVKVFCTCILQSASRFDNIPLEIANAAWDRSLFILRGLKYGRSGFDRSIAAMSILTLDSFCLKENLGIEVAHLVGYNMNNMRVAEINEIFKRVGISDFCSIVGRHAAVIEFFGAPNSDVAHGKFLGQIEEFYESRNEIAHSIGTIRGTGPIQVSRYLDFFDCATNAFVAEINLRIPT
jgi:hypothetical protein